jgi:hypothetical protein
MSKLYDALRAHDSGKKFFESPGFRIDSGISKDVVCLPAYSREYKVSAIVQANVIIPDDAGGGAMVLAKERAWGLIVHEVFGEFRDSIMIAKRALYERDFEAADRALSDLHYRMFQR